MSHRLPEARRVMTPFVIAEFASCHDGELDRMLLGVEAAKQAGADAFKTAWCSSAERVAERMHAGPENLPALRVVQWPRAWLPSIRHECQARGLEFLCTVDAPEDIAVVAPYVDRFKIASWGATDWAFIEAHAKHGKPLMVSLGTLTNDEVIAVYNRAPHGTTLMHCVSAYPTPLADVNLAYLGATRMFHPAILGFSDHTAHVLTGALAVAAGACVLEVHFCLRDTSPTNPDRVVSHEPAALAEYIRFARLAATMLGDGIKKVQPSEEANVKFRYVP